MIDGSFNEGHYFILEESKFKFEVPGTSITDNGSLGPKQHTFLMVDMVLSDSFHRLEMHNTTIADVMVFIGGFGTCLSILFQAIFYPLNSFLFHK